MKLVHFTSSATGQGKEAAYSMNESKRRGEFRFIDLFIGESGIDLQ